VILVVGFELVPHLIPREVTAAPLAFVTLPPIVADEDTMDAASVVVTVGASAEVVKLFTVPLVVPTLLVAHDRK
tara:strand:- start:243 stop:464 length:222 start_codon:yes stop_codon:yes gene_type:complete